MPPNVLLFLAVDYGPLLQTVLGAVIALAGSIAVPLVTEESKKRSERQAVAALLAGELSSYVSIIKRRGYLDQLERVITNQRIPYYFVFNEGDLIYLKQMDRVGLLPPQTCERVIQAYNLLSAALVDAKTLLTMKAEYDKPVSDTTKVPYGLSTWLQTYSGLSGFLSEFLEKAEIVIPMLQQVARGDGY